MSVHIPVSIQLHPDPKPESFKPLEGQGRLVGVAPSRIPGGRRCSLGLPTAGKAALTAFNHRSFSTARCRK